MSSFIAIREASTQYNQAIFFVLPSTYLRLACIPYSKEDLHRYRPGYMKAGKVHTNKHCYRYFVHGGFRTNVEDRVVNVITIYDPS
jgi:hypothetical protein